MWKPLSAKLWLQIGYPHSILNLEPSLLGRSSRLGSVFVLSALWQHRQACRGCAAFTHFVWPRGGFIMTAVLWESTSSHVGHSRFHMSAIPCPQELTAFLPHSSPQYHPSTIQTNIVPWYFPLLPHPGITLESTVLCSSASSASFWSPKPLAIIASGKRVWWHLYPPCPSRCISSHQCNFSWIQGHLHTESILEILQTLQECARLNIYHHKFPVPIPQPLPQPSIVPALRQSHDTIKSSPPTSLWRATWKKGKHYLKLIGNVWLIFSLYLI